MRTTKGKLFKYNDSWKVLSPVLKWKEFDDKLREGVGRNRTKMSSNGYTTSSDTSVELDLNKDDDLG